MSELVEHFAKFRRHIIGHALTHSTMTEEINILYADWTASGRLYQPIENFITETLGPYVANTHTETNLTGSTMTLAYHEAQTIIKQHVNADANDALICAGSGMTTVINKLQRMMGLRVPKQLEKSEQDQTRPIVFVTHMEHHSNQTTWNTCDVDVEVVRRGDDAQPCQQHLRELLAQYQHRALKIGSFTACSNVTGICTDYHQLAKIMHQHGGLCFVDFACSAPYVAIDMHPKDPLQKLDAIFFSPHKFLGGPGSCGVLLFDRSLYATEVPDQPGGGTVTWTNPWGQQGFYNDIEVREDGGTPGFLQTIRAALAIQVKDTMNVDKMAQREQQLTRILMSGLSAIAGISLLEPDVHERLCVVSFYSTRCHYNLMVRLLNDKFGIQARGGCSCAGTYGHILLNVDKAHSESITGKIDQGDLSDKPGWIRLSLHPTNTDEEAQYIVRAVEAVMRNLDQWQQHYVFNCTTGEYINVTPTSVQQTVLNHFDPLQLHANLAEGRTETGNRLQETVVTL